MIQANVLSGGEFMEQALLYRQPEPRVMAYLQNNLNSVLERGQHYTDQFVSNLTGLYNMAYSDAAIKASKQLLSQAEISLSEDVIYVVPEEALPNANHLMQQYIMAHRELSENYRKNLVQGYPDTFYDRQPGSFGEDRYDYQNVMSDILQHDSDGEGYIKTYSNTDDRDELDLIDKLSILDTWRNVSNALVKGVDPTDLDSD